MIKPIYGVFAGLSVFLLSIPALAQTPFDCNGRIFRVLEEQGGS
ncbi:MAG TPA: hypothetical protein PKA00_21130 [Saprospiraceae bacterium]|nr:hypothetical protein [Saprospiraceae bacterium]HMQ85427.1 hypothetical protein [Saprospiraceae bacterium]